MKRTTISLSAATIIALAIAVGAQTQSERKTEPSSTPTQTQSQTQKPASSAGHTLTLIGCIEPTTAGIFALNVLEKPGLPVATAGQTVDDDAKAQASLSVQGGVAVDADLGAGDVDLSAQVTSGDKHTGRPIAETVGTSGADSRVGQRIQLMGGPQADLQTHQGHKVEVTGTMTSTSPGGQPRLHITKIRMIAKCISAGSTAPR